MSAATGVVLIATDRLRSRRVRHLAARRAPRGSTPARRRDRGRAGARRGFAWTARRKPARRDRGARLPLRSPRHARPRAIRRFSCSATCISPPTAPPCAAAARGCCRSSRWRVARGTAATGATATTSHCLGRLSQALRQRRPRHVRRRVARFTGPRRRALQPRADRRLAPRRAGSSSCATTCSTNSTSLTSTAAAPSTRASAACSPFRATQRASGCAPRSPRGSTLGRTRVGARSALRGTKTHPVQEAILMATIESGVAGGCACPRLLRRTRARGACAAAVSLSRLGGNGRRQVVRGA